MVLIECEWLPIDTDWPNGRGACAGRAPIPTHDNALSGEEQLALLTDVAKDTVLIVGGEDGDTCVGLLRTKLTKLQLTSSTLGAPVIGYLDVSDANRVLRCITWIGSRLARRLDELSTEQQASGGAATHDQRGGWA